MLDLPPPFSEIALREGGDAMARARLEAQAGAGAGLLIWVRRFDSVDCAVLLEPEEPLAESRFVLFAGLAAVVDALAAISPPEKPLELAWPDQVRFDGGLVGGGQLAWPEGCAETDRPDWLVFGFTLRTALHEEAGATTAPPTALIEEGFDDFENGPFVESFARHLMLVLDDWAQGGPANALAAWRRYGQTGETADLATRQRVPSWIVEGEVGR